MNVVGLSGGIGSGKSIVALIFEQLGVPVYNADRAVHALYESNTELITRIKKDISDSVFDKNGKINRKKLGEIVFSDDKLLQKLNSIVHPIVKGDFSAWLAKHKGLPYVLKEAAILLESGASEGCDKIIMVVSTGELRIARIRERDHKTKAEIEQIMSRQMSDEEKISKSDFVIYNDEKQMVIPQVLKIHAALMK